MAANESEPLDGELPHDTKISELVELVGAQLDFDQWKAVGTKLCKAGALMQLTIGQWWADRDRYDPDQVSALAAALPYTRESLDNLARVWQRIAPPLRNGNFDFHQLVAVYTLPHEDQQAVLAKQENEKWPVTTTRSAVKTIKKQKAENGQGLADVETRDHPKRQTQRYVSSFVQEAKYEHRAPDMPPQDMDLSDDQLEELIEACSKAAEGREADAKEYRKAEKSFIRCREKLGAAKQPTKAAAGKKKASAHARSAPRSRGGEEARA